MMISDSGLLFFGHTVDFRISLHFCSREDFLKHSGVYDNNAKYVTVPHVS